MRPLVFFSILILCTACSSQGLQTVEPSPILIATATQSSLATSEPKSSPLLARTISPSPSLPSPTPLFEVEIDNLVIGGQGLLYASGFSAIGDELRHFAQWDGTKWVALRYGFQTAGSSLVADGVGHLYTEILTESEHGMATAIMRWDGITWEDITGNLSLAVDTLKAGRVSSNVPVVALAVDGEGNLYATGSYYYPTADHTSELPMGYVAKWNQETWTVLGQGFDQVNVFALATSPTGDVFVSGEQPLTQEGSSGFIARWDGEKWRQINSSKLNITLNIASDKSGGLYAGTQWSVPGQAIAHWDGTNWITIADQLEGEAPAVFDMAVDADGGLYIGGSFEAVNSIPARNIAYWDGRSWHALGEGVNERVQALAIDPGGELYAAGFFTTAGGLPVQHVARWDGDTWHALAR